MSLALRRRFFRFDVAAGIRRSRAPCEFGRIARRAGDGGRRAISRRRKSSGGTIRGRSGELDHQTMSPKTPATTLQSVCRRNEVARSASPADFAAQWTEARLAYPLYAALAKQFNLRRCRTRAGEMPPARPTRDVFDRDLKWLDAIDEKASRLPNPPASPEDPERQRRKPARVHPAAVEKARQDDSRSRQDRFAAGAIFCTVRAGRTLSQRDQARRCRASSAARSDRGGSRRRSNGASRSNKFSRSSNSATACAT